MNITIIRISFLLSILFFLACEEPEANIIHLNKQSFSPEEEKVIGEAIKNEILSTPDNFPILDEAEYSKAYDYVSTLFRMLRNTSNVENRKLYAWEMYLVHDDNMRSAFITPGGHLFIYTGLLKTLNTESELVSLIAHEMYYAEKGYAVLRLKEEFPDLADLLLNDVPTPFLTELAEEIRFITFSSTEVEKADQFAIDLLCPFQYDATGLKSILEIAERSGAPINWLDTRPGLDDRKSNIQSKAEPCGTSESTFANRYDKFKRQMLP